MESLRELYRIGSGPSSSHTMAPRKAAEIFRGRHPHGSRFRVTLYGSLAATGKGHLTDVALEQALSPSPLELIWRPDEKLPFHPNGMQFEAWDWAGEFLECWQVYSVGGGRLRDVHQKEAAESIYDLHTMTGVQQHCETSGLTVWEYVESREGPELWPFLRQAWEVMGESIQRGLRAQGVLPGGLGLARKAWTFYRKLRMSSAHFHRLGGLAAFALAVSEENAAGGQVVTAPTCGSCGVLPAVLHYLQETVGGDDETILRALATAGLIGNLVKHNASISGAEVGCQGEIGTACAMAAGAATQFLGGTVRQIEYAAEMGLEHHLGLTCDPVSGLVQIPCIERNVFAAARAVSCADYALFSDGGHRVSFDQVVAVMQQTGHDLPSLYRETSSGGLAAAFR